MTDSGTGFVVLYRWRVALTAEADFVAAWKRLTELIREHQGGRGSRLHRGHDGLYYGYAQWPDQTTWEAQSRLPDEAAPLLDVIKSAIVERFEPILLDPIGDLLVAD